MTIRNTAPLSGHAVAPAAVCGWALGQPAFCFEPDPAGQGGNNPPAGDPPEGGDGNKGGQQPPPKDTVSRAELQRVIEQRDAVKNEHRGLLSAIGGLLGVSDLTVETVDGSPTLKGDGIEELQSILSEGRKAQQSGKTPEEIRQEEARKYQDKLQQKVQEATRPLEQKVKALQAYIAESAVKEPIRAAAAAEGAFDDGSGRYDDLVALLAPRGRVEFSEGDGEDNGVVVTFMENDDTPLTTADGKPASARDLVKAFLDKRPHMKRAEYRRGPGDPARSSAGGPSKSAHSNGATAAHRLFGRRG